MCLLSADVSILAEAGSVIAIGLSVVFLVLLLLTGIFMLFGFLMSRKPTQEEPAVPTIPMAAPVPAAPVAAPIVGNTETVSSKPDVDGGVPAEEVAVISAAVASMAPEGTQYVVKGIRKV